MSYKKNKKIVYDVSKMSYTTYKGIFGGNRKDYEADGGLEKLPEVKKQKPKNKEKADKKEPEN